MNYKSCFFIISLLMTSVQAMDYSQKRYDSYSKPCYNTYKENFYAIQQNFRDFENEESTKSLLSLNLDDTYAKNYRPVLKRFLKLKKDTESLKNDVFSYKLQLISSSIGSGSLEYKWSEELDRKIESFLSDPYSTPKGFLERFKSYQSDLKGFETTALRDLKKEGEKVDQSKESLSQMLNRKQRTTDEVDNLLNKINDYKVYPVSEKELHLFTPKDLKAPKGLFIVGLKDFVEEKNQAITSYKKKYAELEELVRSSKESLLKIKTELKNKKEEEYKRQQEEKRKMEEDKRIKTLQNNWLYLQKTSNTLYENISKNLNTNTVGSYEIELNKIQQNLEFLKKDPSSSKNTILLEEKKLETLYSMMAPCRKAKEEEHKRKELFLISFNEEATALQGYFSIQCTKLQDQEKLLETNKKRLQELSETCQKNGINPNSTKSFILIQQMLNQQEAYKNKTFEKEIQEEKNKKNLLLKQELSNFISPIKQKIENDVGTKEIIINNWRERYHLMDGEGTCADRGGRQILKGANLLENLFKQANEDVLKLSPEVQSYAKNSLKQLKDEYSESEWDNGY